MARKDATPNGHDRLEEAIAMLIQNEAAFVGRLSESDSRRAETDRLLTEYQRQSIEYQRQTAETFARIEKDMAAIMRVLAKHSRILERLPEAIREKIGFKPKS